MSATRFLFVSTEGCCSELARQTLLQGGQVKLFICAPSVKDVADGFVAKTEDWRGELEWADVVVFDDTQGMGQEAASLRRSGKAVVGGTPLTDRLEMDRGFGQGMLEKNGIETLPSQDFGSIEDAIHYVEAHPRCYVAKPGGAAQNIKRLVFVGEDLEGRDILRVLRAYDDIWHHALDRLQLQRRVWGIEVAIGAFFNGHHFLQPVNLNFEHKRLFPGQLGPMTGEMGTTMCWLEHPLIFKRTLARLEDLLRQEGFTGYFDLNCIVNEAGIWPLEFTPRFGYPTINVQLAGLKTEVPDFLEGLARGTLHHLPTRLEVQVGVRLRLPPYPYRDPDMLATFGRGELRIEGPAREGICIEDARCVEGRWFAAGDVGAPLVVTASAPTMREARAEVYRRIARVKNPSIYYRNDIGESFDMDIESLGRFGYLERCSS